MERFPYSSGRTWRRIFAERNKEKRQALMRSIYSGGRFKAAVDFPTCAFAADLLELYPDAKVSLDLSGITNLMMVCLVHPLCPKYTRIMAYFLEQQLGHNKVDLVRDLDISHALIANDFTAVNVGLG